MGLIKKAAGAAVVINTHQSRKYNKATAKELRKQTEIMARQAQIQEAQARAEYEAHQQALRMMAAQQAESQRMADIEAGAAWHPDPWGHAAWRWHDSREWTAITRD